MKEIKIRCEYQYGGEEQILAYNKCHFMREEQGVQFSDLLCKRGEAECPIKKMLAEKASAQAN